MEKRINTLAELMNVFADVSSDQLMDIMIRYLDDIKENGFYRYPFPLTDRMWIESLMDSFLQADGNLDLVAVFRYGLNDYVESCTREDRFSLFLTEVENYLNKATSYDESRKKSNPITVSRWQKELKEACQRYEQEKMKDMGMLGIYRFTQQFCLASDFPS